MNAIVETLDQKIESAAAWMLTRPQGRANVRHLFYPGIYIREMSAKAGSLIIGRVYREAQVNIMSKGVVALLGEDGSFSRIAAPQVFLGKATRKVACVIEDMVWMNVFATDERDVETLERMYLEESPALKAHLSLIEAHRDEGAYNAMLSEIGYTREQVRTMSERSDDLIPWPIGEYKVKIGDSAIAGKGLMATADITEGEIICHMRLGDKRTPAGRHVNHSDTPNAQMFIAAGNVYLRALKPISGCVGGLDGEEVTVDYRFAVELGRRLHHE